MGAPLLSYTEISLTRVTPAYRSGRAPGEGGAAGYPELGHGGLFRRAPLPHDALKNFVVVVFYFRVFVFPVVLLLLVLFVF
jgi:hypothetical protein